MPDQPMRETERLRELIAEVWAEHRDPLSDHYNACQNHECAWCQGTREALQRLATVEQETIARIHRWYREGVEIAQCGNPVPTGEGPQVTWQQRGFQWFHANMRFQEVRADLAAIRDQLLPLIGDAPGGQIVEIDYETHVTLRRLLKLEPV